MATLGRLNRQFWNNGCQNEPNPHRFELSFTCANGADPTLLKGRNVKVSRAGEGLYDIELPLKFDQLVSAQISLLNATLVDGWAQVVSYTKSTRTVRVMGVDRNAGTPAADDLDGVTINVTLVMQLSPQLSKSFS